jgi:hypothetical protein
MTSRSFFLLLNSGPIHDHPLGPEQNIAITRDKDVGLKESSAGLTRNLPRLRGSYESRCVLLFSTSCPLLSSDSADSALDDALVAPFFFFGLHHSPFSMCLSGIGLFFFFLLSPMYPFLTGYLQKTSMFYSGRESCHSCIIDSHDQYHTDLIEFARFVILPKIPASGLLG